MQRELDGDGTLRPHLHSDKRSKVSLASNGVVKRGYEMTRFDQSGVSAYSWPYVQLSDEQKQSITFDAQAQLAKRLKALIECISDFGFGRGQVLLVLIETNFIEYGKTVLTSVARVIQGADAEVCLGMLRSRIMPEIIASILPRTNLAAAVDSKSPVSLSPDGLWEEFLDVAYAAARPHPGSAGSDGMNGSAFRTQYTFRLRRERFRNAFRQKLEAALAVVIREVGRGVRQRLSPTISEIRAQARQRRRTQVNSEQQLFSDPRFFSRDWSADLPGICLAFEGKLPLPEAWRTRKNITTWSEVSELIATDRALRSRVQKYIRRRLSGTRATEAAQRDEKAG